MYQPILRLTSQKKAVQIIVQLLYIEVFYPSGGQTCQGILNKISNKPNP
jgi:hypothetical protein